MKKNILVFLVCVLAGYFLVTLNLGCAQIGAPTGGPKDTLAPVLTKASPEMNTTNFDGNKVTVSFDEYIDLQELQGNVIVSPLQKTNPTISFDHKSISIKFKDSLLANTTYSVNFGNSLRDVHEGNILKNFTYVFSTGPVIDSLSIQGKVLMAETDKADSTIIAMLYRNTDDTAVLKTKPNYITKLDGEGNFKFKNLPDADFKIYALKDVDGGKTYNSKSEVFAFTDTIINSLKNTIPVVLYAYAEEKSDNKLPGTALTTKAPAEKKLRYTNNLAGKKQDLLQAFELTFNSPVKKFDSLTITLSDTNYRSVGNYTLTLDSTRKKLSLNFKWIPETDYLFILPKESIDDSVGNVLSRSDTIRFITKLTTDYGRLLLRFTNLDLLQHPVLQFLEGETVKQSFPVSQKEWSNKLFPPGEYSLRILYDLNNNGIWDPGNYSTKQQPERVTLLPSKIAIKADWDNEREIKL